MPTDWRATLTDVYAQHARGLLAFATTITGSRAGAEDAVHEAFARLCRRAADTPDAEPIGVAYVYRAVRNAAIDGLRREDARRRLHRDTAHALGSTAPSHRWAPDPATDAASAEDRADLMRALDTLKPAEREAVILRAWGGLSLDELAATTGEPRTTVSSRYHRALQKLKRKVGQPV